MTQPQSSKSPVIYQLIGDPEMDPPADWRELLARLAGAIAEEHYQTIDPDRARHWPRGPARRILESVLDGRSLPQDVAWPDIQTLEQHTAAEEFGLGVVLGAALAATWPTTPAGFDAWMDRAQQYADLPSRPEPEASSQSLAEVIERLTANHDLPNPARDAG